MPLVVRGIAMVLLGLPGGILWIVGMITFLFACWNLRGIFEIHWAGVLISLGLSALASAIGFSMLAAAEMLNGEKRYQMPARRLPAYLGWELLEGFLAVALVGLVLAAISSFAAGKPAAGGLWTFAGIIDAFSLAAAFRITMLKGREWRAELTHQPPPSVPEAGS